MDFDALQIELFVADLQASLDFYVRILGCKIGEQEPNGYTTIHCGRVTLALNIQANIPEDHPVYIHQGERPGRGVELMFWVKDLARLYVRVKEKGWPISEKLQDQPWGLRDFCLIDPDGYFLRFIAQD